MLAMLKVLSAPQPATRNPNPETRNPKPETRNPKQDCGIAPNGDALEENHDNIDHIAFAEFDHYEYMKQVRVLEA